MCWKPERVITFPKDYSGQTVVKDLEEVIFQFPAPQRVDLVDPPPPWIRCPTLAQSYNRRWDHVSGTWLLRAHLREVFGKDEWDRILQIPIISIHVALSMIWKPKDCHCPLNMLKVLWGRQHLGSEEGKGFWERHLAKSFVCLWEGGLIYHIPSSVKREVITTASVVQAATLGSCFNVIFASRGGNCHPHFIKVQTKVEHNLNQE